MRPVHKKQLLKDLLMSPENTDEAGFLAHRKELIRFYFSSLLRFTDSTEPVSIEPPEPAPTFLPVEEEVSMLLQNDHSELFLRNIFYHLRRNKKYLPPSLLPFLLNRFKSSPQVWPMIYREFPDLVLALAASRPEWDYMTAAFDPGYVPVIGSALFYETLYHRIRTYPDATSAFIRSAFPTASRHHRPKLIEILGYDPHPDHREFLWEVLQKSEKPVRMAVLKIAFTEKIPEVYLPVLEALKNFGDKEETGKIPSVYPHFRKDLESFTGFRKETEQCLAVLDPGDYAEKKPELIKESIPSLRKAALLHRDQGILSEWIRESSHVPQRQNLLNALNSDTKRTLLKQLYIDSQKPPDALTFDLLAGIRPFMDEESTRRLWEQIVSQWENFPFYFDQLPLEIFALRIHPNLIRKIWQHPILQDTDDKKEIFRDLLKYRLAFLKICYK